MLYCMALSNFDLDNLTTQTHNFKSKVLEWAQKEKMKIKKDLWKEFFGKDLIFKTDFLENFSSKYSLD